MDHQTEIAKIAYELYLSRGGAPGDPVLDWLVAEQIYADKMATRVQAAGSQTQPEMPVMEQAAVTAAKPARKKVVTKPAPTAKTTAAAIESLVKKAAVKKPVEPVEQPKAKRVTRKKAD